MLEALTEVVHGEDAGPRPAPGRSAVGVERSAPAHPGPASTGTAGHEARYEVMYLLEVPAHADGDSTDATAGGSTDATATDATAGITTAAGLRRRLAALGDSVVVAAGGSPWRVHVHTGLPDAAVAAGAEAGRPRDVRVTPLEADGRSDPSGAPRALAVVACAAGQATAELCRQAGAVVVVSEPAARASTGDVLHALLAAGAHADTVVVLPGDPETAAVARQAVLGAAESGVRARVLPSRAQVQVFAALAVLDPDDPSSVDAAVAAVGACRHGAVAVATRDALTAAGACRAGDAVATVADEVVLVRPDLAAAACDLVDLLLADGGELVTLVPGADADGPDAGVAGAVRRHLARRSPDVEVAVVGGGQARYALLVGCE